MFETTYGTVITILAMFYAFVFGFYWIKARNLEKKFIKSDLENFTLRMEVQCLRSEMAMIRELYNKKETVQ